MAGLRQIYDVDLKLLRCFCAIVDEGGFNAAQASLNLSQSVLSEHLKSLELRLGARLCQRGPKGFKLFPEGEVVYQAAKELFASMETFKQRTSTIHDRAHGELSIGIQDGIVDNPNSRISEALELFSENYPNVRFNVEMMLGFQNACSAKGCRSAAVERIRSSICQTVPLRPRRSSPRPIAAEVIWSASAISIREATSDTARTRDWH
jgi:hypothetical protein